MIFMCGDVHGDFRHILPAVQKHKPAAIIFLGDLQAQQPLEQVLADVMALAEVWWIHGNHDTDSQKDYDHLFGSALADRNLHGRVVEIDGLKVAGLGGIFREKIWWPVPVDARPEYASFADYQQHLDQQLEFRNISPSKHKGELLKHRSSIFWEDWYGLYGQESDILVSHEAPSCHPHGFAAIDTLAQSMGVQSTFHGHQHDCLDYASQFESLTFRAYGVGLRGITGNGGSTIIKGRLDEKRSFRQHP